VTSYGDLPNGLRSSSWGNFFYPPNTALALMLAIETPSLPCLTIYWESKYLEDHRCTNQPKYLVFGRGFLQRLSAVCQGRVQSTSYSKLHHSAHDHHPVAHLHQLSSSGPRGLLSMVFYKIWANFHPYSSYGFFQTSLSNLSCFPAWYRTSASSSLHIIIGIVFVRIRMIKEIGPKQWKQQQGHDCTFTSSEPDWNCKQGTTSQIDEQWASILETTLSHITDKRDDGFILS